MLSNKSLGIAGAAMLGSVALLGTNAANAAIDLSGDKDIVFASETTDDMVGDSGMYYKVNSGTGAAIPDVNLLDIVGKIGVGATQDTQLIVKYTLEGMVFGSALTNTSIELYAVDGDSGDRSGENLLNANGQSSLSAGGGMGDSSATFSINTQTESTTTNHELVLRVPALGVSASGGTAKMSVEFVHGLIDPSMAGPSNMVKIESGVMAMADDINNPTAMVERGYMDFGAGTDDNDPTTDDRVLAVTVGSFQIGVQHYDASDGTMASLVDVFGADAIDSGSTAGAAREEALSEAQVTFEGGSTMFAEAVWLDTTNACALAADSRTNLIEMDDDGNNNGKLKPSALIDFGEVTGGDGDSADTMSAKRFLCLQADGSSKIPASGPFNGKISYGDRLGMSMSDNLGRIQRDGVSVWLPYLTTDMRYNQRLIMVNNGDSDAAYSLTFLSEDGVDVTAGMNAMGTLKANSTTVLHLRKGDVMMIDGSPQRTSAELIVEAQPQYISVATNQTNSQNGGTDTVVYEVPNSAN